MAPSKTNRNKPTVAERQSEEHFTPGNANMPASENGSMTPLDSDRTVAELIKSPRVHGVNNHDVDSAEALQTVARVLSRASKAKASAQTEAAEWKRKYELERARNLLLEQKGGQLNKLNVNNVEDLNNQVIVSDESTDPCELCSGEDDICAREVLQDGSVIQNKMMRKASFKLSWFCKDDKYKRHKHDIVSFEKGDIKFAARSSNQISLTWDSPPQSILILKKPDSEPVMEVFLDMVRWFKQQKKINVIVAPEVKVELSNKSRDYDFVKTYINNTSDEADLHAKVDFIVTLGGDGTVLWAASMFKGPVPPIVPFSLGSLGFMTQFSCKKYKDTLEGVLERPMSILLRHRLQCYIVRHETSTRENIGPMYVLNEVTIDRGPSAYLTNLECFCDGSRLTLVQGDGLILATTSGSTAYSLAAGGSMVHPQVPGILFTPICPHSLSFRPLILPELVTIKVVVPEGSRGAAWAAFDGKDREKLYPGDALVCSMGPWPVPTVCKGDSTSDFLRSILDGLHWNLRETQKSDGPRET